MNDQSKAALWAVNTVPSRRSASWRRHVAAFGRVAQRAAVDAVHRPRADPLPRPPQPDQRRPLVDDGAVVDRDDRDLQDAVAAQRQPGRLDVDHGEAGEHGVLDVLDMPACSTSTWSAVAVHARQPRPWV